MRVLIAALVFAASSVVSAQTVESMLDVSALGWGPLDTPRAVETDGVLDTREWLIAHRETGQWRLVAERPSGLCAGGWFDPLLGGTPFDTFAEVQRLGLVHKVIVRRLTSGLVIIVRLDTPSC